MAEKVSGVNVSVNWRGKEFRVEMSADSILGELGLELQRLTSVKPDTMKLMVPQLDGKGSKLFHPFSVEHSSVSLKEMNVHEGKSIRMMGVFDDEIEDVSNEGKADLRILGFEEEEQRLKARTVSGPIASLRLPPGPYTFQNFRTLEIPGIVLYPPAAEALKRMHMLACDPGIIAIMNKHRWQVGIMTEMAPVGYVGISPKCVLGFNKNHGEEISLRLRTDDLKGFRKYESIKKTLLHELAHMVHSEHDAKFFALDRQLNEEAANLDWTKSRSYTLSGRKQQDHEIDEYPVVAAATGHKLGGNSRTLLTNPRISSAVAAHNRLLSSSSSHVKEPEPDTRDASQDMIVELNSKEDKIDISGTKIPCEDEQENSIPGKRPLKNGMNDYPACGLRMNLEPVIFTESNLHNSESSIKDADMLEPDSDDLQSNNDAELTSRIAEFAKQSETREGDFTEEEKVLKPNAQEASIMSDDRSSNKEVTGGDGSSQYRIQIQRQEPLDCEDHELQRITEPASLVCSRLQHAIENLRSEVTPPQVVYVLQTLTKIIRNVIEHPDDIKFRKLRKSNPVFQKNVAAYKAAMDVLSVVGFQEDLVLNENGVGEAFVVLRRNDPGLLWLAKSSLEMCSA